VISLIAEGLGLEPRAFDRFFGEDLLNLQHRSKVSDERFIYLLRIPVIDRYLNCSADRQIP